MTVDEALTAMKAAVAEEELSVAHRNETQVVAEMAKNANIKAQEKRTKAYGDLMKAIKAEIKEKG